MKTSQALPQIAQLQSHPRNLPQSRPNPHQSSPALTQAHPHQSPRSSVDPEAIEVVRMLRRRALALLSDEKANIRDITVVVRLVQKFEDQRYRAEKLELSRKRLELKVEAAERSKAAAAERLRLAELKAAARSSKSATASAKTSTAIAQPAPSALPALPIVAESSESISPCTSSKIVPLIMPAQSTKPGASASSASAPNSQHYPSFATAASAVG